MDIHAILDRTITHTHTHTHTSFHRAFQVVLVVKNLPDNAGDIRYKGLIPGSFPGGEGMTTHSSILAWRIPWTEKLGRLQSTGLQRVGYN